jgi:hypothetical protein
MIDRKAGAPAECHGQVDEKPDRFRLIAIWIGRSDA